MKAVWTKVLFILLSVACTGGSVTFAQSQPKSQEISEDDGRPVLIKHLPDYQAVSGTTVFGTEKPVLEKIIGEKPVLAALDFAPGTEFVTAVYPEGRLLIVEYTNPQSSVQVDASVQQILAKNPQPDTAYKRIGNYNVFLFGMTDAEAAAALIDRVKYEKTVQWLGEDPYLLKKLERYMVTTSKDIMISTVLVIVLGLATSIFAGIAAGFIFYRFRDHKRATRTAFSDAGGLTRLNLDGLSE